MPNVETHKPGTFCWFELATSNQEAAKKFYTSLFEWKVNDSPMGPDDYYSMFELEGRPVAAGYTMRHEQAEQGVTPHWMVYVAVESADEVARRAPELGGKVFAPPFDVADYGRMTVVADPTHAVFSVWQPKSHQGTGIAGVDGTVCWVDLNTSDLEKAKKFYANLFGWKIVTTENDPPGYLAIQNGDQFIGGIPSREQRNPQAPSHWMIYFLVSDCDAAAGKAKDLGGTSLLAPQDVPNVGRMSVWKDPQGAVFALFQAARR